ncbi:MAG: hypothetical protein IPN69_19175 [Acidobacteria bacterium]|nr:hypothetical protein [Acidobacteriota bacterium]
MKKASATVLSIISLFFSGSSQNVQKDEVFVSSWKTGNEMITEQTVQIKITPENPSYEKEVLSDSGKVYKLLIVPNYSKSLKGENWKVELREVGFDKSKNVTSLGDDLLYVERPGEVGDNFPRGDLIAYFYPNSKNSILINNVPWIEGVLPIYPVNVIRTIQVEDFLVILRSGEIQFNAKDKVKVDLFEIFIEFTNTCNRSK